MTAFEVLAEPHRRQILDLLRQTELPVGGLVEVRVDGQRRMYRVRTEPLRAIDEWLAPYRAMWNASLDRLERHLDAVAADERQREGSS